MMGKAVVFLRKRRRPSGRNGYRVHPGTGWLAARRRAGFLRRAYPSQATEPDDARTELTVAEGPKVRIHLPPAESQVRTFLPRLPQTKRAFDM